MIETDHRIPVRFGPAAAAGPEKALLIAGDAPMAESRAAVVARFAPEPRPFHAAGCACCAPRGAAADALGRLFLARARGGTWFRDVLAVVQDAAGEAAVTAAVSADAVTAARFRIQP